MRGHQVASGRGAWPATMPEERLTSRERQVMDCVASGLTDRGVAAQLGLSHNTVKFHLKNVYAKFGVAQRAQAVEKHVSAQVREEA